MGHALNGSIQDALIRDQPHARSQHACGSSAPTTRGSPPRRWSRRSSPRRGPRGTRSAARSSSSGSGRGRRSTARDRRAVQAARRLLRLRAASASRSTTATCAPSTGCSCELHEQGLHLPRQLHGQLGPGLASAISDLEVEDREVTDTLYEIDYPLEGADRVLAVATVRPETMLADTAVAVNPERRALPRLVGKHCVLPLVGRRLPIIADEHVDPEFGTGALKITPGHDPNDFEIGRAPRPRGDHRDRRGRAHDRGGRRAVRRADRRGGARGGGGGASRRGPLRGEEPYTHSVPFSHRSGERIEPLISLQWFCRMDELAEPAIEVVERRRGALRPRARRAGLPRLDARTSGPGASRASCGGATGCRSGTAATRRPTSAESRPSAASGGGIARTRTCSTPGSARRCGRSPTLGWPDETPELQAFYPTDVLITAREIIFLWVARMVMMGSSSPARSRSSDVYVHSVIQAPDGRRMSKSLGTGIDPLDEIERARRRRPPLRPAGDVLDPGRALLARRGSSRAATWPTSSGTPRG